MGIYQERVSYHEIKNLQTHMLIHLGVVIHTIAYSGTEFFGGRGSQLNGHKPRFGHPGSV